MLSRFLLKCRYSSYFTKLCNVFTRLHVGYGPLDQTKVQQADLDAMVHDKILTVVKHNKKQCYYYNTSKLGEVLMETMIQESSEFCKVNVQQNWGSQEHHQVLNCSIFYTIYYLIVFFLNS